MDLVKSTLNDENLSVATNLLNKTNGSSINQYNCLIQNLIQSQETSIGCPFSFDSVLCWPHTSPSTMAILPCFTEFLGVHYDSSQNATRYCHPNGTWDNYTDYDQCHHLEGSLTEHDYTPVELPTNIYYIGYTLSLISLTLALAVFIHFKDLRCLRNTIHANLFLTYNLSAILWIITLTSGLIEGPNITGIGCICLAILFNYFTLTNFFWMLVEGLYLYMLVVETFTSDNLRFKMYAFIGWGCPAIIIGIWTTAKSFVPSSQPQHMNRLRIDCTWVHKSNVDWIFEGPICACLLINLVFLIRIMWVLIIKLRSANTAETRQYKKATKALLVLIPLLGITHIVVVIDPPDGVSSEMFASLEALLISSQGFFVALLYCFLNSEVKQALRHRLEIWREKRNIGVDSQLEYRKHRYGNSKEYSSHRSRTESIRLTSNGLPSP